MNRLQGTVAWYSPQKGYGYINYGYNLDYYVEHSAILADGTLNKGDRVEFEVVQGEFGQVASAVTHVPEKLDLLAAIQALQHPAKAVDDDCAKGTWSWGPTDFDTADEARHAIALACVDWLTDQGDGYVLGPYGKEYVIRIHATLEEHDAN